MKWIKASECKPGETGRYFVKTKLGKKRTCVYHSLTREFTTDVDTWLDETTHDVSNVDNEEVEKAAEKEYPIPKSIDYFDVVSYSLKRTKNEIGREAFIKGAEWQQSQNK